MFDEKTEPGVEDVDLEKELETPEGLQPQQVKTLTQEEVDAAIERKLLRERASQDRRLQKLFGTKNLNEAAQYAQAGRAVAQAAGVPPTTVVERVQQQYGPASNAAVPQDDVQRQLAEIRDLLANERGEKVRQTQMTEAQKEFGSLFDQHKDEILTLAEERDLPVTDAASIALRPYLKTHYEQQAQTRQQVGRQRQIEPSKESPAEQSAVDHNAVLTPAQKEVARKMGLTYKDYYEQLKAVGRAPE